MLSKNTNEDLDQYLKGLLDFNDRRTHEFIREMIAKKGDGMYQLNLVTEVNMKKSHEVMLANRDSLYFA